MDRMTSRSFSSHSLHEKLQMTNGTALNGALNLGGAPNGTALNGALNLGGALNGTALNGTALRN